METVTNIPVVTHVIQQALTPVFLLGAVGAFLNVLTGRLARIVDRFRFLSETAENDPKEYCDELVTLPVRVRLIHWAISLCTLCALFVCTSIVILFVGAELELSLSRVTSILFIAAMVALTSGLLCFLREVTLATDTIKIRNLC
ncbi:MAG: DUF2721 domain-containing protein [Methylococcales bacterium]